MIQSTHALKNLKIKNLKMIIVQLKLIGLTMKTVFPLYYIYYSIYFGASPSGKAAGFGPAIRRFESFRPSQKSRIDELFCGLAIWIEFFKACVLRLDRVQNSPASFGLCPIQSNLTTPLVLDEI